MLTRTRRHNRSRESRMLEMADRLFTEFDHLPVGTVLQTISAVTAELHDERGEAPSPERVESLCRQRLHDRQGTRWP